MSRIEDFEIENGELKRYRGQNLDHIVIPKGVKVIGTYSLAGQGMLSVTIPDGVISIGKCAFSGCSYLTSVTIPDSVTNIGVNAFNGCKNLTTVVLPDSITRIGKEAFSGCLKLSSINLPNGMRSIGEKAFFGCDSLKSIKIPESVTSIGMGAFALCENLSVLQIPQTLKSLGTQAFFKCKNLADENGFIIINNVLFGCCSGNAHIIIPDGVKIISGGAFYTDKKIVSVAIPDSVENIGESTFGNCHNLASITIPAGLKCINPRAFTNCTNLKNIILPGNIKEFDGTVFELVWQYFSETPLKINILCSFLKQLSDIVVGREDMERKIKANKKQIIEYAINTDDAEIIEKLFNGFKKIKLDDLDEYIKNVGTAQNVAAFLLNYKDTNYTTEIQQKHESDKLEKELGFKERTLAEWKKIYNVETNGDEAIITGYKGSDPEVLIPENIGKFRVVAIGDRAFSPTAPRLQRNVKGMRKNIQTIIIPSSVRTIGTDAFHDCSSLTTIVVNSDNSDYSSCDGVLFDKKQTTLLWYPTAKQEQSYEVPETVTKIAGKAFSWCKSVNQVVLPDGATYIGEDAFCGCVQLMSVTIPDTVSFIGNGAFKFCEMLVSVVFPKSLESIGDGAFRNCKNLRSVVIPDNVKTIGDRAFCFCSELSVIKIPASVTNIGPYTFVGCRQLRIHTTNGSCAYYYARENRIRLRCI